MFAKDFADGRTTDVDLWEKAYRNAFNDCMNQYTAIAPLPPKKQLQKQAAVPLAAPETSEEAAAVKPKAAAGAGHRGMERILRGEVQILQSRHRHLQLEHRQGTPLHRDPS